MSVVSTDETGGARIIVGGSDDICGLGVISTE